MEAETHQTQGNIEDRIGFTKDARVPMHTYANSQTQLHANATLPTSSSHTIPCHANGSQAKASYLIPHILSHALTHSGLPRPKEPSHRYLTNQLRPMGIHPLRAHISPNHRTTPHSTHQQHRPLFTASSPTSASTRTSCAPSPALGKPSQLLLSLPTLKLPPCLPSK